MADPHGNIQAWRIQAGISISKNSKCIADIEALKPVPSLTGDHVMSAREREISLFVYRYKQSSAKTRWPKLVWGGVSMVCRVPGVCIV
jgi:hypothetical protein